MKTRWHQVAIAAVIATGFHAGSAFADPAPDTSTLLPKPTLVPSIVVAPPPPVVVAPPPAPIAAPEAAQE